MAGIAGIIRSIPFAIAPLLEKMADRLCFSSESKTETWNRSGVGLCRVRVGIDNPEQQPIFNSDRTRCIIMSGECFDYEQQKMELMNRGHVFKYSKNDAEFCLHLHEEYGDDAFTMLNGSFCLAIYDLNNGELLLVSDRLGSRPLFYGTTPDEKLIFATQVSSVLCSPEISRTLDAAAAMEFCALQRVLGEKTYHSGVKMLASGSILRWMEGVKEVKQYWEPDYIPQPASADEYAEELATVLKRSAGKLHRGDARVAMLLSGGLDGRMVVAAVEDRITCYSFGDYLNPEVKAARDIAEIRGFEFHFLPRDPDQYATMLDTAVELGNGMHPFNHAHALGFIDTISQECNVITHGYAVERLFRGTLIPKTEQRILGLKSKTVPDETLKEENFSERLLYRNYSLLNRGITELFTPEGKMILKESLQKSIQNILTQSSFHATNIFDKYMWPDLYYHSRFPSMVFEYALRAYMTERNFYMNNDIIDLHLKMPMQLRSDNRVWLKAMAILNKEIARAINVNTGYAPSTSMLLISIVESGKGLLGSLPLLWRIANKKKSEGMKQGQSSASWPRFDWMIRNNPKMRKAISEIVNDAEALPPELFNHQKIKRLFADHLDGQGHHRDIMFVLLTFGRWHKKYITH